MRPCDPSLGHVFKENLCHPRIPLVWKFVFRNPVLSEEVFCGDLTLTKFLESLPYRLVGAEGGIVSEGVVQVLDGLGNPLLAVGNSRDDYFSHLVPVRHS